MFAEIRVTAWAGSGCAPRSIAASARETSIPRDFMAPPWFSPIAQAPTASAHLLHPDGPPRTGAPSLHAMVYAIGRPVSFERVLVLHGGFGVTVEVRRSFAPHSGSPCLSRIRRGNGQPDTGLRLGGDAARPSRDVVHSAPHDGEHPAR